MALHAKAKAEAGYRFYALYDKISREDILAHAYAQCRSNKGAPGVDGQAFTDIEVYGVQRWLGELEPGDHIVQEYRGVVDLRLHSFTLQEIRDLLAEARLHLVEVQGLNDRRDGYCESANLDRDANGFLVAAQRREE